ncbi:helicase SKI2W [Solenopsis invicta]|uniref:helicase SKI2W n=1 Tax=Solenopsis invicta TaxID=13686 RepID=UPI00193E2B58|nr:helicase SKI2W [Solenopsis invicta]XP_011160177.2 helicase SKI2W [Solenopsis invicta]XP_025995332.2 helicase SKI2W [Solenopsis invicta]XP_039304696.1 helicase SKI2W [Solenopsis invicta]
MTESTQLFGGPPPIWPDIRSELREYIECPERLPIHQLDNTQCYWPRKADVLSLLEFDLAPISTTLKFDRDPITGKIGEIQEINLQGTGETARNSMSMTRAPGSLTDGVRGNPSNIPFWPGGFEEPKIPKNEIVGDIDFEKDLRTLAKGFSSGLEFKSDNCTPVNCITDETEASVPEETENSIINDNVNLMAVIHEEGNLLGSWSSVEETKKESVQVLDNDIPFIDNSILSEDTSIPILKISEKKTELVKTEWAEQLDISAPVTDFEKKIPDPAITFSYELDTFQKQAILKLEKNSNVFVAAHTSAGKTTVAEYAIALSQKHMTRVIYTSPIKALSNQKYREFKRKFESVGLLTGDLQINQTASCLIMTTEILQSMLYCASDVLRDLEFVIFDEVHYINNEDRGHVWEEIVILLPQTINIVMLSATVPNPIIFADWVGRIKKRKMYVISTLKRPIPLLHYLYTGTDGKTKDDKFLVLDSNSQFLLDGWYKATNASDKKKDKSLKNSKRKIQMTPKQEDVLWRAFISHLQNNDMLPVVVFTLSRKRCDMNAATLRNLDLTTAREKHHVHVFFQSNIKHLKGSDRELPQVLMMQELLQKGVGIHHSGILPILREIVEMLFQSGVVKLLFATETFAMGVNMPARTVVFDSIRKYDGNSFRTLYPTEYIQMAGRAGRRGHDTTGTVIVMCRNDVPHFNDLKPMMCGEPQTLESKFKVTYSMLLNLRRVNESVTVEAMMRKSFKESPLASQEATYNGELQKVERELSNLPPLTEMQKKLSTFYHEAVDYLEDVKFLNPYLLNSKKAVKGLIEGRVLLISYANHYKKLALLLQVIYHKSSTQYKVLILKDANVSTSESAEFKSPQIFEKWCEIIGLTKTEIFVPSMNPSHEVVTLSPWHILKITNCQIKVDCSLVLNDWEKRQISRFKNDPPGQTCQMAIQELTSLSFNASSDALILQPYIEPSSKNDFQLRIQHRDKLKANLHNMKCTKIPNFEEQFRPVFERNQLEDKKRQLQLKLSDEGMALYPEYLNMVALLKHFKYIDNDERVALKGRVALQMGSNELLITELILKNVLTVLQPAEIAALLSALIFQQRTEYEPKLTPTLTNACKIMTEVHAELEYLEQYYQLSTLQPLNFGLVEIVYEWAQAKSFAEIMKMTDVQEGIIVRCIQQLGETLRDVKNAAVTIGDPVLKEKMEEASTAIKRDIVFAASLYTQD